jgi:hypothetical protein
MKPLSFAVLFGDALIYAMANNLGLIPANRVADAQVIFFPGGPDVDPSFYGERPHPTTFADPQKNQVEKDVFEQLRPDVFKVGICGGGQILNVLNGGKMFQHSDHPGRHSILYHDETNYIQPFEVNSTHHQLMRLGKGAELWGWTNQATFRETGPDGEPENYIEFDNEIIFYPNTRTLCFQPHPEYGHKGTRVLFERCFNRMVNYYAASEEAYACVA